MNSLIAIYLVLLVLFAVAQGWMAWKFLNALGQPAMTLLPDGQCPQTEIVLCLRGADPFLGQCIERLLNQDYPDYTVQIVIDHENDPAAEIVQQILQNADSSRVRIEYLTSPSSQCSLKCSSLVQAVRRLPHGVQVVALVDADTMVHRSWLRELVTPLAQPDVGAATGNRWYMPSRPTIGAMFRFGWNCAAIVQMHAHRIGWGGTLAIRRDVIQQLELPDRWSRAFCEDTMLFGFLKDAQLKQVFVPSLMMINRENCAVGPCYRWVCRQLLTARLYHPRWWAVAAHGIPTALLPVAVIGLALWSWQRNEPLEALIVVGAFAIYVLGLAVTLWSVEKAVQHILRMRNESVHWISPRAVACLCIAAPILQVLYPVALLSASWVHRIAWRGVEYRIGGPWKIGLLEYRPYPSSQTASESL